MPTTTKWGLPQILQETPGIAKGIANATLYLAAIGNIAVATFTKIPPNVQAEVALYSLQITAFVNAVCHMFGIQVTQPTYSQSSGTSSSSATKMLILLMVMIGIGASASAQSPFKPEAKVILKTNPFVHAAIAQPDSSVGAWRFTANLAAYNYTFGGGVHSANLSGAEYGYEWQTYNYITSQWVVNYSVNVAWFPINTAAPISLSNLATFGLTFGFKNPIPVGNSVIQLGPDYNFNAPSSQKFGLMATVGILLN